MQWTSFALINPASASALPLSRADADAGLMSANEIHRIQNLYVRGSSRGAAIRINHDLRSAKINKTAEARIHCDHLVFGDVAADKYRQAMDLKIVQHQCH